MPSSNANTTPSKFLRPRTDALSVAFLSLQQSPAATTRCLGLGNDGAVSATLNRRAQMQRVSAILQSALDLIDDGDDLFLEECDFEIDENKSSRKD